MAISVSNSALIHLNTNHHAAASSRPQLGFPTTSTATPLFRHHQSCPTLANSSWSYPGGVLLTSSAGSKRSASNTITPQRVLLTPNGSPSSSSSSSSSVAGNHIREKTTHPEEWDPTIVTTDEDQKLADCWRKIHGQDDWDTLIHPRMDNLLRSELIRYGEKAQACYDAFDYDEHSLNCGRCKYTESEFFTSLDQQHHGYEVTKYLYAASKVNLPNFFKKSIWPSKMWDRDTNWMGYVSVSNDETTKRLGRRDIAVAWRGTVTQLEWFKDLMDILCPISSNKIPCWDRKVKVESGFLTLYTDVDEDCVVSARDQLLEEIERVVKMYQDEEISITITGHSLGSALAVLSAFDIAESGVHLRPNNSGLEDVHVSVFSFSGPRVGNTRFKERLERLGVKVLRAYNVRDMVPMSPGLFLNEDISPLLMRFTEQFPWTYSHVGTELELDHKRSPWLKENYSKVQAHNMEALLHLIDGYHGTGEKFELATPRDVALVNKASDFLKDDLGIPPNWRQDGNKGMVKINGAWKHCSILRNGNPHSIDLNY